MEPRILLSADPVAAMAFEDSGEEEPLDATMIVVEEAAAEEDSGAAANDPDQDDLYAGAEEAAMFAEDEEAPVAEGMSVEEEEFLAWAAQAEEGGGIGALSDENGFSLAEAPERPLLILPGIAGTFAAPGYEDIWFTQRGLEPEGLVIDPLAGFYNDIMATMENAAGYTPNVDLFAAHYDWRMAPGPAPVDAEDFNGIVSGLDASSLTDGIYTYGVDYLGYWLERAVESWTEAHGEAPESVDIIAHSTGGLVARTYIQSTAYNDSNDDIVLPKVNNLAFVGVPNRGASKAWNPLQNNFGGDPAYRVALSKVSVVAYEHYLNGDTIYGADGDLVFDPDDPEAEPLSPVEFIEAYVPTIRGLLATYDFLIAEGETDPETINDSEELRNRWLLHLNDGLDIDYTLEQFENGHSDAAGRDPHRFVDLITGTALVLYSAGDDDGLQTATTVETYTGPQEFLTDEIVNFHQFYGGPPGADEVWYRDIKVSFGGDGTVPLTSSVEQFQNDPQERFVRVSEGPPGEGVTGYWVRVDQPNLNDDGEAIPSSISHTGIMLNVQSQIAMLDQLGIVYDPEQISTDLAYNDLDVLVRAIRYGILTPTELLTDEKFSDVVGEGFNNLLQAGFDELIARVVDLAPGDFLQEALPFLPDPIVGDDFHLNDYLRLDQWLAPVLNPIFSFLENEPEATTADFSDLLKNLEIDVAGLELRVDEERVLAGLLTSDEDLLNALEVADVPDENDAINELFFRLPFQIENTFEMPVSLGKEIQRLGIRLGTDFTLQASATLSMELSFGYDLREGLASDERFFLRTPGMSLDLEVAAEDIEAEVNLGIVKAAMEGGSIELGATLGYLLASPSDHPRGNVTQADFRDSDVGDLFTLVTDGRMEANMPIQGPEFLLGGGGPIVQSTEPQMQENGFPVLQILNENLFTLPEEINLNNFGSLEDFLSLSPAVLEDLILQLADRLHGLADLGDLAASLPFADDLSFWDAVDFGQVVREDFVDHFRDEEGQLRFDDLNSFVALTADILGMDPADIGGEYLPEGQELSFTFDFSRSISLHGQPLGFSESFGPLQLGLTSSGFSLTGDAGLSLNLVVDLTRPSATVETEEPLPADGQLEEDLVFALSIFGGDWIEIRVAADGGNESRDDLIADINAALVAAGLIGRVSAKLTDDNYLAFSTVLPTAFPSLGLKPANEATTALFGWENERIRVGDPMERARLEDASITADLQMNAGPISVSGQFGFLEVFVEDGSADLNLGLEVDLTPGGPVSIKTIYDLARTENPAEVTGFELPAVDFTVEGEARLSKIRVMDGFDDDPAAEAEIRLVLYLQDDPSEGIFGFEKLMEGEFAGLERYANLSFTQIFEAVVDLANALADASGNDFLNEPIPPIDRSFNDLVELGQPVLELIERIQDANPRTIQEFGGLLTEILYEQLEERVADGDVDAFFAERFPDVDPADLVRVELVDDRVEVRFHQIYETELEEAIRLDLADQVPGLDRIIDVQAQSRVQITAAAILEVGFAIDLSDDTGPSVEVLRETGVEIYLGFDASDISINAAVGSIGFFIREGHARLTGEENPEEMASIRIGLNENGETGGIPLDQFSFSDFSFLIDGKVDIELPVFFPTETIEVTDSVTGEPAPIFVKGSLSDLTGVEIGGPNFDDLIAGIDDLMETFGSGLDVFFFLLDEVADGELFGLPIPLIGDQLATAATFIGELREEITLAINLVDSPVDQLEAEIANVLFNALGPANANLLLPRDGEGPVTSSDIDVTVIVDPSGRVDEIKIDLPLGQILDSGFDFEVDLGLPGLPLELEVDGGLSVVLGWEFDLVFGVSRDDGFFIETQPDEDDLRLGLEITLPDTELNGFLGFFLIQATDNPDDPSGFNLDLGVDLSPPVGDRLNFETLSTQGLGFVDATFQGGLALNLLFEAGFGSASDEPIDALPSFLMDFELSWDFNGDDGEGTSRADAMLGRFGSAPQVALNNARLDVGTFFDDFLGPIAETISGYLGPLEPIIDVLTTDIGALSNLQPLRSALGVPDGQSIDLLFLAERFSDVPDSTRDFIEALGNVISLANLVTSGDVPGRGSNLTIPMGSFGFGSIDLRENGVGDFSPEQLEEFGDLVEEAASLADRFAALEGSEGAAASEAFAKTSMGVDGPGTFDFRLLSMENVVRLLSGDPVEIFEYTTPEFSFDFDFRLPVAIWSPPLIELFISGGFGARAQMTFGYDSTGIQDWRDSGELSDVFNGFYVRTGPSVPPQLSLDGFIGGGVQVTIPPVRGVAEVRIGAEANFNLIGGADEKLYFRILADHIREEGFSALRCYFIIDGRITASLLFSVEDIVFGSTLIGANPIQTTLWEFDTGEPDCACAFGELDDRLEDVEGGPINNNAPAVAADLGVAPGINIEGASISSSRDIDWYSFELLRPEHLMLILDGAPHLNVSVYDEDQNLIRHSEQNRSVKNLSLGQLPQGRYLIHIESREQEASAYTLSLLPHAINSETRVFYVNNSSEQDSSSHNFYSLEPGDDDNDGLSPTSPVASVQAILDNYTLTANDVIVVDSGDFSETITVEAGHSGFILAGAPDVPYQDAESGSVFGTTFEGTSSQTTLSLENTSGIRIHNFTFDGGARAIDLNDVLNLTVTEVSFTGQNEGITGIDTPQIRLEALTFAEVGRAIDLSSAAGAFLTDVEIVGEDRSGDGIVMSGADDSVLRDIRLRELAAGLELENSDNLEFRNIRTEAVNRPFTLEISEGSQLRDSHFEGGREIEDDESFFPSYEGNGFTAIDIHTVPGLVIQNVAIDRFTNGVALVAGTDVTMQSLQIREVGTGLDGLFWNDVTIVGSIIEATGVAVTISGGGEMFDFPSENVVFQGNFMMVLPDDPDDGFDPDTLAVYLENNHQLVFSGNEVYGGLHLDSGEAPLFLNNDINGFLTIDEAPDFEILNGNAVNEGHTTITDSPDGTVFNNTFANGNVTISGSNRTTFTENTLDGGSLTFSNSGGLLIDGNTLTQGNVSMNQGTGFDLQENTLEAGSVTISGGGTVDLIDNLVATGVTLDLSESSTLLMRDNQVNGGGVVLTGSAGVVDLLKNAVVGGISLTTADDSVTTVTENQVTNGGITVMGGFTVTLLNNNVTGGGIGVIVSETSTVTVKDNSVAGGNVSVNGATVVLIEENSVEGGYIGVVGGDEVTVLENQNEGTGIRVSDAEDILLQTNTVTITTGDHPGISLTETSDSRLLANIVTNGIIRIEDSDTVVLNGNVLENSGIHAISSTAIDILENQLTGGDFGVFLESASVVLMVGNVVAGATFGLRIRGAENARSSDVLAEFNNLSSVPGSSTGIHIENTWVEDLVIRDNIIEGFASFGINSVGYAEFHRNSVSDSEVGVRFQPEAVGLWENSIFENTIGLTGSGFLGNDDYDAERHNLVYGNVTGIVGTGVQTIAFNRIYLNEEIGLRTGSGNHIHNNVIFRNDGTSVLVDGSDDVTIHNNTIYSSGTFGVRLENGASNVDLRNNIVWSEAGYVLSAEFGSDVGFSSDYNNLFTSGSALLVDWQKDFDDLLDWQIALQHDLNSIGYTRIDPELDSPVFRDLDADDYRIQHVTSTTINSGDPTFSFENEPGPTGGPNGLRVNLGAYGNTAHAALSPDAYVRVLSPNFYLDYNRDLASRIIWESFNVSGNVSLELHEVGGGKVADMTTVSVHHQPSEVTEQESRIGSYFWSPGMNDIEGDNDARYVIRVVPAQGSELAAENREAFSIPEASNQYYLNDSQIEGTVYTTAPGDNRNTGLTPNSPKASLHAFLQNYELSADQTVYVDSGYYLHLRDVIIGSASTLGGNEAFTLIGPSSGGGSAVFDRGDSRSGTTGIILDDASFVSIRNLTLTGADRGLEARNSSTFLTLENLEFDGHASEHIYLHSGSTRATLDNLRVLDGGSDGIVVEGRLERLTNSLIEGNAGRGLYLSNTHDALIDNNRIIANSGGGIEARNDVSSTLTVIGYNDLNALRGNVLIDNAGVQVAVRGNVEVVGNTVYRTEANEGSGTGIVAWNNDIDHNVVFGHAIGIQLDQSASVFGNRVYNNTEVGIRLAGNQGKVVAENVIHSNPVGIYSTNSSGTNVYRNNLIFDASVAAVDHRNGNNITFHNNTLYQMDGDGLRLTSSTGADIRNNIFVVNEGTALRLDIASQSGLTSNYNLFDIGESGAVGLWEGVSRAAFADWRNASFLDPNSVAADPLFVQPGGSNGISAYVSFDEDGSDSNFHLQSSAGSPRNASLAPVRSGDANDRPVFPSLIYVNDAELSPALDRGDASFDFDREPGPNGNFINIGAFGNTELASLSPETYVLVKNPQGGETWPVEQNFEIRWRSHDFGGTVDILLIQDSAPEPILTIGEDVANSGSFTWTVDDSIDPGSGYRVEIIRTDDSSVRGESFMPFTISEAISFYYVNDDTVSEAGYTTAPGDNGNDGLHPSRPKASIRAVLETYDLGEGDIILVDAGLYTITTNIILQAADAGITIRGFHDPLLPNLTTTLDRGSSATGSYIFELTGGSDITFEHLTFTNARHAIYVEGGAEATDGVIRNNRFVANSHASVHIDSGNHDWLIEQNEFNGSGGGNQATAITARVSDRIVIRENQIHGHNGSQTIVVEGTHANNARDAIIENNHVYDNQANGIRGRLVVDFTVRNNLLVNNNTGIDSNSAQGDSIISGNVIHGHSGHGIDASGSSLITDNEVYDNRWGITASNNVQIVSNAVYENHDRGISTNGSNLILDNHVYDNGGDGIRVERGPHIEGNVVHGNDFGIAARGASTSVRQFTGTIVNNLVYDNSVEEIRISITNNNPVVANNTILTSGLGIHLANSAQDVLVRNNILVVDGGLALQVSTNSQPGFDSDFNLYHLIGESEFALWGDLSVTNLADWFYEVGQGLNSIFADPLFMDEAEGDYRLAPESPGIAAGDLNSAWVHEGEPSGGRINIGLFGGTADATTAEDRLIQVLSPVGLSKLLQNESAWITFFTYGFSDAQSSQWWNAGSNTIGPWQSLNSDGGNQNINNNDSIDLSGVDQPAPEGVYQNQRRSGLGEGNRMDFSLDLPEGDYVLRLHMATPDHHASRFDILIDGAVVRENFDLAAEAGAANTAVVEEFAVTVDASGTITISMEVLERYAYLSGIEVMTVNSNPVADPTFTVEASLDGGESYTEIATGVTVDNRGIGRVSWTPQGFTLEADAIVRITSEDLSEHSSVSDTFLVANDGNVYYVNDDSLDHAVHTTAIGDNANSGKSPDAPMASLVALFTAYSPGEGDIVYIDSGTYRFNTNLVLTAAESGISLIGAYDPENAEAVTVFDRGNNSGGSYLIELTGGSDITIENFVFTNSRHGIVAGAGANSTGVTIRDNYFVGNSHLAISINDTNDDWLIEGNTFDGSGGTNQSGAIYVRFAERTVIRNNEIYDYNGSHAIEIAGTYSGEAAGTVIEENTITNNSGNGIRSWNVVDFTIRNNLIGNNRVGIDATASQGATLITGNVVYGSAFEGINVSGSGLVTDNEVFENRRGISGGNSTRIGGNEVYGNTDWGISTDGSTHVFDNHVYDNHGDGIRVQRNGLIEGNVVHGNDYGIAARGSTGANRHFTGTIVNNLVYDNSVEEIRVSITNGNPLIANNTLVVSGIGIHLSNNAQDVTLRNNIVVVNDGGRALEVSTNSQPGFDSDYNLYDLDAGAEFVRWGDVAVESLADWYYELGQGLNSFFTDPHFANAAEHDYSLLPDSPAIAMGDLDFAWIHEQSPAGGRVNIGAYGGTSSATPSDDRLIQVLSPVSLTKLLQNEAAWIEFFTYGFTTAQSSLWFNAGNSTFGQWQSLNSDSGSVNNTNNSSIDRSGVTDPAPEGVYQNHRRSGFGEGSRMDFTLDLPEGDYVLRLHLATVDNNASRFDILIDGEVVRGNYNLAEEAGAANTAVVEEFAVSVDASGQVTVSMEVIERYAYLSGIEVMSANANPIIDPTFTVEASIDGGLTYQPIASGVTVDNRGIGRVEWVPKNFTLGAEALVRVVLENLPEHSALSSPFLVANDGNTYYVNNDSLDHAVHTVAVGDNANSGKSPDSPMASLSALLNAYSPNAGDIIYIDSGDYIINRNIILTAAESGVTIIGAFDPENSEAVTTLDRGNLSSSAYILELAGAADVTIEHLVFTNAYRGIHADEGGAPRLTVRDSVFYFNQDAGIYVNLGSPDLLVENSTFEGSGEWNVSGRQSEGIYFRGSSAFIRDNTFVNNYQSAVYMSGWSSSEIEYLIENNTVTGSRVGFDINVDNALIIGNTVTDSDVEGIKIAGNNSVAEANEVFDNNTGITARENALVLNNRVYHNNLGISLNAGNNGTTTARGNEVFLNGAGIDMVSSSTGSNGSLAEANRVYANDSYGIRGNRLSQAVGNQVYSNQIGIIGRDANTAFAGLIENNLVYANEDIGIRVDSGRHDNMRIANNTVYQPTGEALRLRNMDGGRVFNNILWVDAGFALTVDESSQGNVRQDYNLFFLSPDPNARIAEWGSDFIDELADWQAVTGLDSNSRFGDPRFFDPNGADDILGYREVSGVFIDGGLDDNFHLAKFSPAIDAGATWWAPKTDLEGDERRIDPGVPNEGADRYIYTVLDDSLFDEERGEAQGWSSSGGNRLLELPFLFPFYGELYGEFQVTIPGFFNFENNYTSNNNSENELISRKLLAPFWGGINTWLEDRDIFVDTSVEGEVYIRYEARNIDDNSLVQFAVLLREDGSMRFDYGSGNVGVEPTIGISFGNQIDYEIIDGYSGSSDLGNAASVEIELVPGIIDIGAYEFKGDSSDDTPPVTLETDPAAIEEEGFVFAAVDQFVVRFSESIDSIDAASSSAYELILDSDGDGIFTDADTFFTLLAHYDPETDAVTLTVEDGILPSGDYRLRIFADNLRDVSGNRLDGDGSGEPGGNYVREFTIGVPVLPEITSSDEMEAVRGEDFTYQIEATESPFSFGAEGLPAGLFVDSETGLIFGTPTEAGVFEVTLFATNNDGEGSGTLILSVVNAPKVINVTVNGGEDQRSMVWSVVVAFDADFSESFTTGDIRFFNRSEGYWIDDAITELTWSFIDNAIVVTFPGLPGESLEDGVYSLVLDGEDVTSSDGIVLDANGDGSSGGTLIHEFHRLFGDTTGNGRVDNLDAIRFRSGFGIEAGQPGYNPAFDGDASGMVDTADRSRFLANLGTDLNFDDLHSVGEVAPPVVETVVVNDGDIQRSVVTSLEIVFSRDVGPDLTADDFRIFNRTTGVWVETDVVLLHWDSEEKTARLTFPGLPAGSLPDGVYTLVLTSSSFIFQETELDGDGSSEAGGDFEFGFFRLFGDSTGSGQVNNLDGVRFRAAFGSSAEEGEGYLYYFDDNLDGVIDTIDRDRFEANFGNPDVFNDLHPVGELAPPLVESVVVNDGDTQRSVVTSLDIVFSRDVGPNLTSEDFHIFNRMTGVWVADDALVLDWDSEQRTARLTFPGLPAGSLPDGVYTLVLGSSPFGSQETELDGDGGGEAGGEFEFEFFRLFGDSTGSGQVNNLDGVRFRAAFGSSVEDGEVYRHYFDDNLDGVIDTIDLERFEGNFGNPDALMDVYPVPSLEPTGLAQAMLGEVTLQSEDSEYWVMSPMVEAASLEKESTEISSDDDASMIDVTVLEEGGGPTLAVVVDSAFNDRETLSALFSVWQTKEIFREVAFPSVGADWWAGESERLRDERGGVREFIFSLFDEEKAIGKFSSPEMKSTQLKDEA